MQQKISTFTKRISQRVAPNIEAKQYNKYRRLHKPKVIEKERLERLFDGLRKVKPTHAGSESKIYLGKKKVVKIFHNYEYKKGTGQRPLKEIFSYFQYGFNELLKNSKNKSSRISSFRCPKIFGEQEITWQNQNKRLIEMERINGVNFDELLNGIKGDFPEGKRGEEIKRFFNQHKPKLSVTDVGQTITELDKNLSNLSKGLNYGFTFRFDSFLVEGFDKNGNMKIVFFDIK